MNVKEWLIPLVKAFYAETRRFDRDSYPESCLGRMREERGGFGQGALRQHYPEVRCRDGLMMRRAIEGMPFALRAVLDAHYAAHGDSVTEKAKALGLSKPTYWVKLDCAYYYLAGRIERLDSEPVEN